MEVTSYFDCVVSTHFRIGYPAFTNLFVRTEYLSERNIILVNRRPRDNKQKRLWLFHTLTTDGEAVKYSI